jgi:hypothetical protein
MNRTSALLGAASPPGIMHDHRMGHDGPMLGGIVMAVILVFVFPVAFLVSMAVLASAIGSLLKRDADVRGEGSELLAVSRLDPYSHN